MSTLTEIERAVDALPTTEQEELFRLLAARFEAKGQANMPYRTRTRVGGLRPGIDPKRLGQLPEEF